MQTLTQYMLKAIQQCIEAGLIKNASEFYDAIGIGRVNATKYKKEVLSFSTAHIQKVAELYNINPNYLFGYSSSIFREENPSPLLRIKEALKELEVIISKK